jgi:hypothetical protein
MKAKSPAAYALVHGASWLTQDGSIWPVPGFHDEWLREHADLVEGCANVCEVVLKKGWISVAVFSEGYVELLVPNRGDPEVLSRIERLLATNRGAWKRVLVMSMEEEGYCGIKPEDLGADGRLAGCIAGRL